jgi:trigger factor
MKISFECADKINGLLTMTVEKADYQDAVEKQLKNYRKKAQVPGFRPGMVPMGMIKKQYGTAVKVDEVNKLLGEKLYEYVRENKIQMLGEPLPNQEKQVPQDFENADDLTFVFDIAVAPEFKAELTGRDRLTITPSRLMIRCLTIRYRCMHLRLVSLLRLRFSAVTIH